MPKKAENDGETENKNEILKDIWSIRPCRFYKEEYDDCRSFKARFHQYFVYGEEVDCSQWQKDYENCHRYEESNGNDIEAGEAVIKSEENRRNERMRAHFANTTWKKREHPPEDWNKPLPEFFAKRSENSYLAFKQAELDGENTPSQEDPNQKSFCTIM